jgi:hypothetical protein
LKTSSQVFQNFEIAPIANGITWGKAKDDF